MRKEKLEAIYPKSYHQVYMLYNTGMSGSSNWNNDTKHMYKGSETLCVGSEEGSSIRHVVYKQDVWWWWRSSRGGTIYWCFSLLDGDRLVIGTRTGP